MILPYITKYNCGGCNKLHRLTFRQWWTAIGKLGEYIATQKKFSKNSEVALDRAKSKFDLKIETPSGWRYRLTKWFIDKIR